MRKKLVESDMIECVITLVKGVFFSTGVNACIILLNKKKEASHKGKICFIEASEIFTAKRAQNIMTQENIDEVFNLYRNYSNVIEKCQIVNMNDISDSLIPKLYILHKEEELPDINKVKSDYLQLLNKTIKEQAEVEETLVSGGYLDE